MNPIQILFSTASLPVWLFILLVALACVGAWSLFIGMLRKVTDVLDDSLDHKTW